MHHLWLSYENSRSGFIKQTKGQDVQENMVVICMRTAMCGIRIDRYGFEVGGGRREKIQTGVQRRKSRGAQEQERSDRRGRECEISVLPPTVPLRNPQIVSSPWAGAASGVRFVP